MLDHRFARTFPNVAAAVALLAVAQSTAPAGPLNPPPGPVESTMKTLDELEPSIPIGPNTTPGDAQATYVIDRGGSYHLTRSFFSQAGKHGIVIRASGVTLDLRGFSIHGTLDGVSSGIRSSAHTELRVHNGQVDSFLTGIDLSVTAHCTIEDVRALGNSVAGIATGSFGRVERCEADSNFGTGFLIGRGTLVTDCRAASCDGVGFSLGNDVMLTRCLALENDLDGFTGEGANCSFVDCAATSNLGIGFNIGAGSILDRCRTFGGTQGIAAGPQARLNACVVDDAGDDGIVAGNAAIITDCIVSNSGDEGIRTGVSAIVSDCTVRAARIGIDAGATNRISGCTINNTREDGILVSAHCRVLNNMVDFCGVSLADFAAGVHATSTNNRIEGNTVTRCDVGYDVDGSGNVIIGNSTGDTTVAPHQISSGNIVAPFLNSATIVTNNSPNANFIH